MTRAFLAVNPGHWTEDMRNDALSVADLSDSSLKVAARQKYSFCQHLHSAVEILCCYLNK